MSSYSIPRIRQVAVVGSGKMGASLFDCLSNCGGRITLLTRSEARVQELRTKFEKRLARSVKFGVLSEEASAARSNAVRFTTEREVLAECDLIIETVTEDAEIKKRTLARIFSQGSPHAIVASNSSSMLPEELVPDGDEIERFCGLHFFYPVEMTKTVEFVAHRRFRKAAYGPVEQYLRRCGFNVVPQNENNAFLINMLTMPIAGGAFKAAEQIGFKRANQLASSKLFPGGPFSLFDHVGLNIIMESNKRYFERDVFGNRDTYARLLCFMNAMNDMRNRDSMFRASFLGGEMEYPHDLPGWPRHENAGRETSPEEHEKIRLALLQLLIGTCSDALVRKLIGFRELDEAVKNIWGAEMGPFEMARDVSNRASAVRGA